MQFFLKMNNSRRKLWLIIMQIMQIEENGDFDFFQISRAGFDQNFASHFFISKDKKLIFCTLIKERIGYRMALSVYQYLIWELRYSNPKSNQSCVPKAQKMIKVNLRKKLEAIFSSQISLFGQNDCNYRWILVYLRYFKLV